MMNALQMCDFCFWKLKKELNSAIYALHQAQVFFIAMQFFLVEDAAGKTTIKVFKQLFYSWIIFCIILCIEVKRL